MGWVRFQLEYRPSWLLRRCCFTGPGQYGHRVVRVINSFLTLNVVKWLMPAYQCSPSECRNSACVWRRSIEGARLSARDTARTDQAVSKICTSELRNVLFERHLRHHSRADAVTLNAFLLGQVRGVIVIGSMLTKDIAV